jgi:tetratricopeptide (TPR) repeat protein
MPTLADSPAPTFEKAYVEFRAGQLDLAVIDLKAVIGQTPENEKAHSLLGYIYLKQDKATEAIDELGAAVKLKPTDWAAHSNLGAANRKAGHLGAAVYQYQLLLKHDSNDPAANRGMGFTLGLQGKYADAIDYFKRSMEAKPDAVTCENLAYALEKTKQFQEAADTYRQAATIDPKDASAWLNAGLLYQALGDRVKAIGALDKAIMLGTPFKYEAHYALGEAYGAANHVDWAIKEFTLASQLDHRLRRFLQPGPDAGALQPERSRDCLLPEGAHAQAERRPRANQPGPVASGHGPGRRRKDYVETCP